MNVLVLSDNNEMKCACENKFLNAGFTNFNIVSTFKNLEKWIKLKDVHQLFIALTNMDLTMIEKSFQLVGPETEILILDTYNKLGGTYPNNKVSQIEWDKAIEQIVDAPAKSRACNNSILVKTNSNYTRVKIEEIEYVSSEGKFVNIALKDKLLTTRTQLKSVAKLLPDNFLMVHRSYLLNIDKVRIINVNDMEVVMENHKIPFSRKHKQNLLGNFKLSA